MAENFVRSLEATARRCADKRAVVWNDGALTYAELDRRAGGVARFLAGAGVKRGDRVALSIPNRWSFVAALLGGWKLGATLVPLDPRLTGEEQRAILDDLQPRTVMSEVLSDEVEWPSTPAVDHPALILYTSGSTGEPKGALLSHAALDFAVRSWVSPVMALTADDIVLAVLPFSHSYGLNAVVLAPLLAGATTVIFERFAPEESIAAISEHRVSVFPAVATMFRRILTSPVLRAESLASLRLAVSGAAPCPWDLACTWRERTGARIVRGYGSTEAFRPISYLAEDPTDRPDAMGRPVPGVEVRVVDDELWIRSPAVMDGYLDAPDETRAVLVDGWLKTGDLATVTSDGFVRIEGRKRERILRGGYSVFPHEVEAVLLTHASVAEAAVVGFENDELGEEVVAFVALHEGAHVAPEELIAYCKEQLAAFKYPRRVTIMDRLPKAATGKVLKKFLAR